MGWQGCLLPASQTVPPLSTLGTPAEVYLASCLQLWMPAATAHMWRASPPPTTQRTPRSMASRQVGCGPSAASRAKLGCAQNRAEDVFGQRRRSPSPRSPPWPLAPCRRPDCVMQDRGHAAGQHGDDGGPDPRAHHVSDTHNTQWRWLLLPCAVLLILGSFEYNTTGALGGWVRHIRWGAHVHASLPCDAACWTTSATWST